ncbi:twin-arginine translocation signal domain-containing protein [Streptomyces sp. YIM 98790]|uniref:twin-arginine translocation signal domain-containing protein n=1 Tax=Streptomyces sp. YIM 98790 TaxID=2689077 RepID=UPI001FB60304|nr:twin-arginine translocation signal domain-containing protein [Streptomyces sp. YIM 98790]
MSDTTRRGFLGIAGMAAAVAGGATALPTICAGPARADAGPETGPAELPIVNRPDHPEAVYPPGAARTAYAEPLNATVDCALTGREDL